jgi:hypothetical protein
LPSPHSSTHHPSIIKSHPIQTVPTPNRRSRSPVFPSHEASLTFGSNPSPFLTTHQAAATRALEAGTTLGDVVDLVARVSPDITAPIVLFTYFNPIYQRGFEPFVKSIAAAGAKGLLVPDIPLEETGELSAVCKANGIDLVLLSTPTTPEERMAKIADKSNGFIYLVSIFLFLFICVRASKLTSNQFF